VAGRGFIKSHAGMSGAGAAVCIGYSCPGRTFRFLELLEAK